MKINGTTIFSVKLFTLIASGPQNKKGCNSGHGLSAAIKIGTPRAQILAVWFQTDLQPPKRNLCLAPDQKMVRPKKVANDQKINLAP